MQKQKSVLIIGYGNPSRLDDGLGPRFIEILAEKKLPHVQLESSMMLNIEHADQIKNYDLAIFVDADVSADEAFNFKQIQPQASNRPSSHHLKPEALLDLSQKLFQARTVGYILGIRGYNFEGFGENISEQAEKNLYQAIDFLTDRLQSKKL